MYKNMIKIQKPARFITNSNFAVFFCELTLRGTEKNNKTSYVGHRIFYPQNWIRFSIRTTDKPNTSTLYNSLDDFLEI